MRGALVLLLVGCSPGVGRPPAFLDAEVFDGGQRDAAIGGRDASDAGRDAGPRRDGSIFLPEAGEQPLFAFSGVFQLTDGTLVFAREIGTTLGLVVGGSPYVYTGQIDLNGNIDTTGYQLLASGCAAATLTGVYERVGATFDVHHVTCAQDGSPIDARLRGAFKQEFDTGVSGTYELDVQLDDASGCHLGEAPKTVRWGLNVLDTSVAVFTGEDVADPSAIYIGNIRVVDEFNATGVALQSLAGRQESLSFELHSGNANDPVAISGRRDIFDPVRGCSYSVGFVGVRAQGP